MATINDTTRVLVQNVSWLADRVIGLKLVDPAGGKLPDWEPGAHIDVVLPSGLVRQYSLYGDDDDHYCYQIAVLLESESRGGSKEIHQTALVGREIHVRGPRNHFKLVPAERYFFVAGGIGITPLLSMIRRLHKRGDQWSLLYVGRNRESMALLADLDGLSTGNVVVKPQDEAGVQNLDELVSQVPQGTAFYCCGPEGMLRAMAVAVDRLDGGVSLQVERFGAPPTPAITVPSDASHEFVVELASTGVTVTVPRDRSVLEVVSEVVPTVLSSCAEGYCGTCETAVLAGTPDHRDTLLSDRDKESNETMMICVSRCIGDKLVLEL